ncbi:MAG: hypothetical protein JWO31_1535, partial [Phycisphaerales bacterium]|nr:hypothetical protein [Phycisphaerales bacterium]
GYSSEVYGFQWWFDASNGSDAIGLPSNTTR